MPMSRLFRSRWSALLWAGGIVWTAYDIADSAPREHAGTSTTGNMTITDAAGEAVDAADLIAVANAAGL
jgi:hypothetical protein